MKKVFSHYKLGGVILAAALCVVALTSGTIEENILALVPRAIKQKIQLFEHSPLSQKLIVLTQAESAEQTQQIAQDMQAQLAQNGLIQNPPLATENPLTLLRNALPFLFSPQVQQQTEEKLTAPAIARQLSAYYEELFSFQSVWVAPFIAQDPFYLTEILLQKWRAFGQYTHAAYEDGFLTVANGTLQAALYDTPTPISDLRAAQNLYQFFIRYNKTLPENARVFFMGGLRYTLENAALIKQDLYVLSAVGFLCLSALFMWLFRTKQALLIYILPLLVLPPAAWVVQLVFGRISGITLGFGSVVAGLSVDYAIYTYFALRQAAQKSAAQKHIQKHLGYTFLTSALCFAALLFSSIEVFRQIAVFALVALSLAWGISLAIYPSYFSTAADKQEPTQKLTVKPLSFHAAAATSVLLLLLGVWGIFHLSFGQELNTLNSTSPAFVQDKKIADELFSAEDNALLFALGTTPEDALTTNENLSARLPQPLPVAQLFPAPSTQEQNKQRWADFWTPARQSQAQQALTQAALSKGFRAESFAPFWQWINQSFSLEKADFSAWYNPVIKLAEHAYAVVNIVPNTPAYAQAADDEKSIFLSASQLQNELVQHVKRESFQVIFLALLFNLIAVGCLLKNLKQTLLCFVPVLGGGCILFGGLALLNTPVNLFGLIFLPLLVGLGIDYAIFQALKLTTPAARELYPSKALLAAGLSTLAGFGILVLAKHAVLHMIGLCALLGIGGAVVVSLWLLPALWERYA